MAFDGYNWDWRTDENFDAAAEYAEGMLDNMTVDELIREAQVTKQFECGALLSQLEKTMYEYFYDRYVDRHDKGGDSNED